jgi:dGTP triphosphohydrolase
MMEEPDKGKDEAEVTTGEAAADELELEDDVELEAVELDDDVEVEAVELEDVVELEAVELEAVELETTTLLAKLDFGALVSALGFASLLK